jgi:anti-anti-sigma regulatory factor
MSAFVMLDLSAPANMAMPSSLTIREAEQIHACLLQAVRYQQTVVVDCSAATEIDLSFIQLVLSARKSARAAGKNLCVVPPPDGLLADVLRRAGLLGAPEAAPSADQLFWFHKEATGGENHPHCR